MLGKDTKWITQSILTKYLSLNKLKLSIGVCLLFFQA